MSELSFRVLMLGTIMSTTSCLVLCVVLLIPRVRQRPAALPLTGALSSLLVGVGVVVAMAAEVRRQGAPEQVAPLLLLALPLLLLWALIGFGIAKWVSYLALQRSGRGSWLNHYLAQFDPGPASSLGGLAQ